MIIISSYGFESPLVSAELKEKFTTGEKVLIIPFAGFDSELSARKTKRLLEENGFKSENILICTNKEPLIYQNEKIDLIYVAGGNPFKLLNEAHSLNIIPMIKRMLSSGTAYFGASAGADFLSEDLSYLKCVEDDDFNLKSYKGLGILKEKILCHSDQRDRGTIRAIIDTESDRETLLIRNDEVYIVKE